MALGINLRRSLLSSGHCQKPYNEHNSNRGEVCDYVSCILSQKTTDQLQERCSGNGSICDVVRARVGGGTSVTPARAKSPVRMLSPTPPIPRFCDMHIWKTSRGIKAAVWILNGTE